MYIYGHEQPATFAERISFGAHSWRYTIPGQGLFRWGEGLRILAEKGYSGAVSIELEDANFNGAEETEKQGILHGARLPGRLLTEGPPLRVCQAGTAQAAGLRRPPPILRPLKTRTTGAASA